MTKPVVTPETVSLSLITAQVSTILTPVLTLPTLSPLHMVTVLLLTSSPSGWKLQVQRSPEL